MLIFKIIYHLNCFIKKLFFKVIYGRSLFFGKNFQFRKNLSIIIDKNARISIGDNCFFNNYCSLAAKNKISIGQGTIFGENVKIYDHNHRFNKLDIPIKEQGYSIGNVEIGKHCWIGSNVTILKGAKIGNNCVIGAGCVINHEIKDGVIVIPSKESLEEIKIIPH